MDDAQPAATAAALDMDLLIGSALTGPGLPGIAAPLFEQYDGLADLPAANEALDDVENLYLMPG